MFNNGEKDLPTKDFLKHDLVHFAIDKILGTYDAQNPTIHTPEIEQVAGILHTIYDADISNIRIMEGAKNMFEAQGKSIPAYLDSAFIDKVRNEAHQLLRRYEFLKTGESLEL
jgi:hypothetical protein